MIDTVKPRAPWGSRAHPTRAAVLGELDEQVLSTAARHDDQRAALDVELGELYQRIDVERTEMLRTIEAWRWAIYQLELAAAVLAQERNWRHAAASRARSEARRA